MTNEMANKDTSFKERRREMKYGPWRQKADASTIRVSRKLIFAQAGRHHNARKLNKYLC
jgi:hypothetical protein